MKRIVNAALALSLIGAGAAFAQAPAGSRPDAPYNGQPAGPNPSDPNPPPPPPGPRPPDVVAVSVPIDLAIVAAKATAAACTGYHVGIAILDQAGLPKLYYIPEGTAGGHAYTGFRKANTALLIGAPSEQIRARMAADKALADKVAASTNYVSWAGGLPIFAGGKLVGAIGVSGAEPSEKDEACAVEGLKAIQDRLK